MLVGRIIRSIQSAASQGRGRPESFWDERQTSTSGCNSTDFTDNKLAVDRDKIQFDPIKLLNGARILCLTGPQSGLSLEKKLAPADAIVRQKEKLSGAFEAALAEGGKRLMN